MNFEQMSCTKEVNTELVAQAQYTRKPENIIRKNVKITISIVLVIITDSCKHY